MRRPSELLGDLGKIESNARHLLGLINDILDLSKIEAGRMEVLAEDLRRGANAARAGRRRADAGRTPRQPADASRRRRCRQMRSDATKLRQMLLNLLSNAAKFTEGGTITLSVERAAADGWVVFDGVRHRHRHDAGADRPSVRALRPGRCLHHAALRRHRAGPGPHPRLRHHAGRRDRRAQHRRAKAACSPSGCLPSGPAPRPPRPVTRPSDTPSPPWMRRSARAISARSGTRLLSRRVRYRLSKREKP